MTDTSAMTPARVARLALSAAREGRPLTLRVAAGPSVVLVRVRPPRSVRDTPTPCERDLLAALAEAECPWTTTRVLAELDRRDMLHGEATVKRALSRLVKAGAINSGRTAPRGYTLPTGPRSTDRPQPEGVPPMRTPPEKARAAFDGEGGVA